MSTLPAPLHCFERGRMPLWKTTAGRRDEVAVAEKKPIRCRFCHTVITAEEFRMVVNASHLHKRQNPAGIHFVFGCFAAAPGCRVIGRPTLEHTWFAGCRWRLALCGSCGEHLGWAFANGKHFFGLIIDRLKAAAS